ncbi:peptide deformylase, partial [Mesorhizobium sp. M2E.F.Ca.ET.219.01.1.1]|uniref:peptide deformylase n=1 Tax=Mesorhizobium sp. M2E.F.Ca.ET.219.01.1.1 TaxID=2500530 RepID=UPI001258DC5F
AGFAAGGTWITTRRFKMPICGPAIYVNPAIVEASTEMLRHTEGSVSMPGVTEEVERHARVRVRYQDLEGQEQFEDAEGLLAVCHLHEVDLPLA